jgi:hypothetical protein
MAASVRGGGRLVGDFPSAQNYRAHFRLSTASNRSSVCSQTSPSSCGSPSSGFIIHHTRRRLKRHISVNSSRKLATSIGNHLAGRITYTELDVSVQGRINHVRFADNWGLREHIFACHPIAPHRRTPL